MVAKLRRLTRRSAAAGWRLCRRLASAATGPLDVLAYHRVAEPRCDPWLLSVAATTFDAQLTQLRDHADPVELSAALGRRRTAIGSRRRFAVTFDDGYVDNLHAALPILERHDLPATVFVPTGFVGEPAFWWDRLAGLVIGSGKPVAELAAAFCDAGIDDGPSAGDQLTDTHTLHERLHDQLTRLEPPRIDDVIDQAAAVLGMPHAGADGRPMTREELAELAGHELITIGAHGVGHRMLTRTSPGVALTELRTGKRQLAELLGVETHIVAYPHGAASRSVAAIARRAGFDHGLTTDDRPVSLLDGNLRLPRRLPPNDAGDGFTRWFLGG